MDNAHIHADPKYRIIPIDGGRAFAVEVIVTGMNPLMMVPFATKAAADIWIIEDQNRRSAISRG